MMQGSIDQVNKDINGNITKTAILAVDIGTTNLKCSLFDEDLQTLHSSSKKVDYNF